MTRLLTVVAAVAACSTPMAYAQNCAAGRLGAPGVCQQPQARQLAAPQQFYQQPQFLAAPQMYAAPVAAPLALAAPQFFVQQPQLLAAPAVASYGVTGFAAPAAYGVAGFSAGTTVVHNRSGFVGRGTNVVVAGGGVGLAAAPVAVGGGTTVVQSRSGLFGRRTQTTVVAPAGASVSVRGR